MPSTAYATHRDFLLHTMRGHPENADRLRRINRLLESSGLIDDLTLLTPNPVTADTLARIHDPNYIRTVEWSCQQGGGYLDADTYIVPASYDAARLASGAVLDLIDAVMAGAVDNGLAAIRPPGHHALPNKSMGFCLFNHIALGADHLLGQYDSINRVMIVDYDVHHGNGTQQMFYDRDDVLFISTHQYPFYPGTGALGEIGRGAGKRATLNLPLEPGTGNAAFSEIYERVIWPVARRFNPDFILVSAGFDAHWMDRLAMIQLDLIGYAHLTRELIRMADELCDGRVVFVLEGGYDLNVVSHGMLNVAHALLGHDDVVDPLGPTDLPARSARELIGQVLTLHQLG